VERTLVLIKPDGVQRGLVGEIISRFERRGLKLVGMKLIQVDQDLSRRHYAEHVNKGFYPSLEKFITSSPSVAMVWEGANAIQKVRDMMGKTDPNESPLGTIRGDYGMEKTMNLVHGSDGPESAAREIGNFFQPNELFEWNRAVEDWVHEKK
jgi:nucleoside-diphosphate kinase